MVQQPSKPPSEPACQRAHNADEELSRALQCGLETVGGEQVADRVSDEQLDVPIHQPPEISSEPACQRAHSTDEGLARALQYGLDTVDGQVVDRVSDEQLALDLSQG